MSDFYRKQATQLEPIEFDVTVPDRIHGGRHRVRVKARHLLYHEFGGLADALIGEIQIVADPSGKQEIKARRLKLKRVALEVSNLDPDEWSGGKVTHEELERWIDADENADAVYAAWQVFAESIDSPPVKSTTQDRGDGGGEDAGETQETAAVALMSAV